MVDYVMPPARSMAALAGEYLFPSQDSPINLERFIKTAVPAGRYGRIVAKGNKLYEPHDLNTPIRLNGNSVTFTLPYLDKTLAAESARKYRARGMNYIRIHGPELYLMVGGAVNTLGTVIRGTRQYSADRWDELDFYIAEYVKAGIYISIGLMSPNLATDIGNTTDRWSSREFSSASINDSGAISVTTNALGQITGATITTPSTGHFVPPAIFVNGAGGVGAKLRCTINAAGTVDSIIVDNGGRGYTASQAAIAGIAKFFGGKGTLKARMHLTSETFARDEYAQTLSDILNHYNPYLGCTYNECPAVWLVEAMNESTFLLADNVQNNVNGSLLFYPMWQEWLEQRYGTILNLNTVWGGTTFQSFADPALVPIAISGAGGTNNSTKWRKSDTFYWRSEVDVKHYQFCEQAARAAGWTGLTSANDLYTSPATTRTQALSGAGVQNMHAYISLNDDFTAGARISTGTVPLNTSLARNPSGILGCLAWSNPDQPIVFTEINSPYPNRYRAEAGPFYAGLFSMYGVSAMAWHSDDVYSLKWGGADINKFRNRGQWPLHFGHDPYCSVGIFFGTLAFMRGDLTERAVDLTRRINDRALSYYANYTEAGATPAPFYDFKQMTGTVENRVVGMVGREQSRYYPNSDQDYGGQTTATAWQTAINRSALLQVGDNSASGINASGSETHKWLAAGNTNTTADFLYNAMVFEKDNRLFFDSVAGVGGLSTARTQTAIVYSKFTRKIGTINRQGRKFYTAGLTQADKAVASPAYTKNCYNKQYWENLEINHADDGVFIGISSVDDKTISNSTQLFVGVAGRSYNTGATWQSANKRVKTVTVTNNQGLNYTAPPILTASSNTGASADQGSDFLAIGVLSGGATGTLTGEVKIINPGSNYPATTTIACPVPVGSPNGTTAPTLTFELEDDDPQKEIRILTPYAADGNEGWPIVLQNIVADFNVRGVDVSKPWVLHEYDYAGTRVATYPTVPVPAGMVDGFARPAGIRVLVETRALAKPSVYFMLEQAAAVARKQRV